MTHEQRNWMTGLITNSFDLVIFQHEQDRLETMLAKYADPNTSISDSEVGEDIKFIDGLHALGD